MRSPMKVDNQESRNIPITNETQNFISHFNIELFLDITAIV